MSLLQHRNIHITHAESCAHEQQVQNARATEAKNENKRKREVSGMKRWHERHTAITSKSTRKLKKKKSKVLFSTSLVVFYFSHNIICNAFTHTRRVVRMLESQLSCLKKENRMIVVRQIHMENNCTRNIDVNWSQSRSACLIVPNNVCAFHICAVTTMCARTIFFFPIINVLL